MTYNLLSAHLSLGAYGVSRWREGSLEPEVEVLYWEWQRKKLEEASILSHDRAAQQAPWIAFMQEKQTSVLFMPLSLANEPNPE